MTVEELEQVRQIVSEELTKFKEQILQLVVDVLRASAGRFGAPT